MQAVTKGLPQSDPKGAPPALEDDLDGGDWHL